MFYKSTKPSILRSAEGSTIYSAYRISLSSTIYSAYRISLIFLSPAPSASEAPSAYQFKFDRPLLRDAIRAFPAAAQSCKN